MLPLKVWDDQLSKEAANWIKRCQFEHEKKGRGENLAFDSNPKKDEELINSSMKAWYDEIKDYNYAAKRCVRSCHYTQVRPYKRIHELFSSDGGSKLLASIDLSFPGWSNICND